MKKTSLWTRELVDQFCEHIANGSSVLNASKLVGLSPTSGYRLFNTIRRYYGAQAE